MSDAVQCPEYEGYTTEVRHEDCAVCCECAAIAYPMVVSWEVESGVHQITDENGVHQGGVRKV